MSGMQTNTYNGYFYRHLFCDNCVKYTTHRTPAVKFNGTFNGDPLDGLDWKCIECEEDVIEERKI